MGIDRSAADVPMPGTLVYFSHGRDCYHHETMFSILSARRYADQAGGGWRSLVYTDRPADYAWLNVDVRALTPEVMERWLGQGGYPFRRKIACVLDALSEVSGKLVFLDGDTYFRRSPRHLFARIRPGRACLHLREKRLTRRAGTAGATLQRLFDRETVRDAAGRPVRLRPREAMWNSGVIGVDPADRARVEEALTLIDGIWAQERSVHTVEQFALGHVFGGMRLSESDDVVFHYWHRRQRAPFLERLPALIERARRMPLAQAAKWAHAQRPVETVPHRAAGLVRNAVHAIGVDHRWTRNSF